MPFRLEGLLVVSLSKSSCRVIICFLSLTTSADASLAGCVTPPKGMSSGDSESSISAKDFASAVNTNEA